MAMIPGLIVTHGTLGAELVRLVELVLGSVEELDHLSNQGRSGPALTAEVQRWLRQKHNAGCDGLVIFVDDYGGSCANAAQVATGGMPAVALLTGVNLAMMLGFATWRGSLSLSDLARKLVEAGRSAITRIELKDRGRDRA